MTKKRIGTIYGSPIIEGDKNLKTSNEIHVSELGGGGEGNNSGIEDKRYYMGDYLYASEVLRSLIPCITKAVSGYEPYRVCTLIELVTGGANTINAKAIELDLNYYMDFPIGTNMYFRGTLNQYIEYMQSILPDSEEIKQFYDIPTITKEEFYALSQVEPINK